MSNDDIPIEADVAKDLERIEKAIKDLGEFYSTVHIFAQREDDNGDGWIYFSKGAGSYHARYGQIKEWVLKEEERTRVQARKEEQNT